jgi:ElaB/YqjD/DUF883 family membrane-anchored ribosome-binding protein
MASTQSSLNQKSSKLRAGSNAVLKKAKKLSSAVSEDETTGMASSMRTKLVGMKRQVRNAADTSVSLAKKYPIYTLAGIAAIGISIGLMIRNRASKSL